MRCLLCFFISITNEKVPLQLMPATTENTDEKNDNNLTQENRIVLSSKSTPCAKNRVQRTEDKGVSICVHCGLKKGTK